ncbi:hypothetical protein GCK72_005946 [Caenorhabditis remanei]|uniref:C2H2-type domain-containing protein n=1 Tax=Caenorhabditis remanei TaxID=31234 RepID=A0A6A5HJ54_CAERE|nr:hypothetical protein GCK72_005946 [Caenorhabditis remanei]KAF1765992.1 hypothetical protein GCK72_005946 [Caenorhabditis remanei]
MPLTVPLIGRELCFWCVENTEDGKFVLPPNSSSLPIFSTFHFERLKEIPAPYVLNEVKKKEKKQKSPTRQKLPKNQNSKVAKKPKYFEEGIKKKNVYSKIHKNAIKTIASEYKPGKKCDQSQKLFLCDICEFSFTLRHNLQVHLVQFHGTTENIPEEKVAVLKEVLPRKMNEEETLE